MAEYGNPDVADEWLYLRNHSAYHLLRHNCLGLPEHEIAPDAKLDSARAQAQPVSTSRGEGSNVSADLAWVCPRVLFTTSTRDDRVHPGHARKMVRALLEEAKERAPHVLYWENIEGGHGGAADNKQRAFMWALSYVFLRQALQLQTGSAGNNASTSAL